MKLSRRSLLAATAAVGALPSAFSAAAASGGTTVQLIRSATVKISFGRAVFLVDPMLSERGSWPGFLGTVNSRQKNPAIDLPMAPEKVLENVSAVFLTHLHEDHWDEAARRLIPKDMPIFVSSGAARKAVEAAGFKKVTVLDRPMMVEGVTVSPTASRHGTEEMLRTPGFGRLIEDSTGFFFEKAGCRSVYLAGDTVWGPWVSAVLKERRPGVVVLNTGNAVVTDFPQSIIMGAQDVLRATQEAPDAAVVAVHMDAINHCILHRDDLRDYLKARGVEASRVHVPADGETLHF